MILENVLIMMAGTALGITSGLIPGVGTVVTLLLSYPFVQHFDLLQTIMFYLAVVSASQFSGSVVATVLGVPGEQSSLPAVIEGHALFKQGQGHLAVSSAAIGSVLGSMIALTAVWLLLPVAVDAIKTFYNNTIQLAILIATSVFIVVAFNNRIQNALLFAAGFFLATVGTSQVPLTVMWKDWIPYEQFPDLYQGLPMFSVIAALFVVPTLAATWHLKPSGSVDFVSAGRFSYHIQQFRAHLSSAVRGSAIGSIAGLVPHLTTVLASNLSYTIEKRTRQRQGQYSSSGDMGCLVAAETANNSAGFVQLVPVLLLGIPITTSEAMILFMLESNSILVNSSTTIESGMFGQLAVWFVAINAMAFVFCWPLATQLKYVYCIPQKWISVAVLGLITAMVWYVGNINYSAAYHMVVFAVLAPFGYLLRNTNTIVLILAFVLQDKLLAAIIRASVIWTS